MKFQQTEVTKMYNFKRLTITHDNILTKPPKKLLMLNSEWLVGLRKTMTQRVVDAESQGSSLTPVDGTLTLTSIIRIFCFRPT